MAQNSPWNGSWKADPSSMKLDSASFTIAVNADGYTVTTGSEKGHKIICNGQPNAPHNGTVTTCTKSGDSYDLENSRDGKVVSKSSVSLSSDGKMLDRTIDVTPTDGSSPFTIKTHAKRVSGGPGMSGVWKEVGFTESQDTGVLTIQVNGDSIDFKETDNDKPITAKLDGTPTKFGDRTVSIKLDGPHTLKVTYRGSDGKVQRANTFVLSPSGKTIHETDVTPAPEHSTMTLVLHKS